MEIDKEVQKILNEEFYACEMAVLGNPGSNKVNLRVDLNTDGTPKAPHIHWKGAEIWIPRYFPADAKALKDLIFVGTLDSKDLKVLYKWFTQPYQYNGATYLNGLHTCISQWNDLVEDGLPEYVYSNAYFKQLDTLPITDWIVNSPDFTELNSSNVNDLEAWKCPKS